MKFTSAAKTSDMELYLSRHDVSFLKRNFVLVRGKYRAQLSASSIYKALEWTLPSPYTSEEEQSIYTISSMLWEMYFYCDTVQMYEEVRLRFAHLLSDTYLGSVNDYLGLLPMYTDIGLSIGEEESFNTSRG
jgi:hypothetical protein